MAKENFIQSTIGRKFIVGLTGLFLISFMVVHLGINSTILIGDNGETFNEAAYFMSHNWLIRIVEIGLLAGILAHIAMTLKLHFENKAKRPVDYAVSGASSNSKWYSRSMTLLGTLLLIFLVIHMGDFWLHTKKALYITGEEENPYLEVKEAMQNPILLVIYLAGFVSLGFHLLHGFPSAFQTLGLSHKKYTPVIQTLGTAFSVIVPALFAVIALALYFDLV